MAENQTQNVLLMLKERVIKLAQTHKSVVKSHKEELDAEKAKTAALQKQVDDSKSEIDMLQMNLRNEMSKSMQYQAMANSGMGAAPQMQGYKGGGSVSEAELENLHEEVRKAAKTITENKETIKQFESDLEAEKSLVEKLKLESETSTKKFEEQIEEHLAAINEKNENIEKLTEELKSAKEKIESLEAQGAEDRSEIASLKEELAKTISEYKEIVNNITIEKDDLFEITQEFDVITFEREVVSIKATMTDVVGSAEQDSIKVALEKIKKLVKRGNLLFSNEHNKMSNLNHQVHEMESLLKNNIYAKVA